ncbi:MAG: hypothetical protein U1E56_10470 [Bauldia sp.]
MKDWLPHQFAGETARPTKMGSPVAGHGIAAATTLAILALVGGIVLWTEFGGAVFFDALAAGLVNCFF